MENKSTKNRLDRLEVLKARLKSGEAITIEQIARELGVAPRTISRDIQILRGQGLPIDADRGRGGGIRLDRHWGIGRVNFNYNEAVDLLLSLAVAEQSQSPLFMANLQNIRLKVMASFSPDMRFDVQNLKSRILIGQTASAPVLSSYDAANHSVIQKLHQAFLTRNFVQINYLSMAGKRSQRCIEPHYLLLNNPVWYILTWDELRQDIRTFRCDHIEKIQILDRQFKLRPQSDFTDALDGVTFI
ncbi:MAG: WYL domain-containing protein [Hyphomicrobiales bacterium]